MASGFFNALQAALAGVAGGAQGYSEYEAEQNRRQRQAQSELLSALAAGYEPPDGAAQEIEIGGKRLKLTETPAARDRRLAAERNALEKRRLDIQEQEAKQRAEDARLGRQATIEGARITASAAGQREAAEREAKAGERSQAGLSWYTTTMRDAGVPQATKNALGLAIAEAQARKGSTLTSREIGAVAADLMDIGASERKFRVSEAAADMTPERFPMGQRTAPVVPTGTAGSTGTYLTEEDRIRDWMGKNPRRPDESSQDYAARMRTAFSGMR